MKFTEAAVEKFRMPEGKTERIGFDETMPGFGLRIRDGGRREHRTYIAQYKIGAKHRRMTLGNVARVTLDAARSRPRTTFGTLANGDDPASERAAAQAEGGNVIRIKLIKGESSSVNAMLREIALVVGAVAVVAISFFVSLAVVDDRGAGRATEVRPKPQDTCRQRLVDQRGLG